jgi:hypothetical protein
MTIAFSKTRLAIFLWPALFYVLTVYMPAGFYYLLTMCACRTFLIFLNNYAENHNIKVANL